MASENNPRWLLIRESIKFQIKLILDAARDLILSPVGFICTVLDLLLGNGKQEGYFQRLMQWGHSTDHWLNLFGDLPVKNEPSSAEPIKSNTNDDQTSAADYADETTAERASAITNQVDENLDKLLGKIGTLIDEQSHEGRLTLLAKQKIANYLSVLDSKEQEKLASQAKTSLLGSTSAQPTVPKQDNNEQKSPRE